MESQYGNFLETITKFDPSKENRLEGPHFSTSGWEQDYGGVHPVEMLARIAKFQNKSEAKFEPYRKPFNRKGNSDFNKILSCTYDSIEAFGNGKQEKQAKLVSARNMILKLKQINIGIVNETIAAGVKIDANPHKKPLVHQFKMFKSAGTLTSFVPASKEDSSSSGFSNCVVDAEKKGIDQFQGYIEGKIKDPSENLPEEPKTASIDTNTVSAPKIVFKRPPSEPQSVQIKGEPAIKKSKNNEQESEKQTANDEGDVWNPGDYGYGNNIYNNWGRGRAFHRRGWGGGRGYGYGY